VIAFCGPVNAVKSLFLNALMGRAILPSDGEASDYPTPVYTECNSRPPFYSLAVPASPCRRPESPRITVPSWPFLAALKALQALQYGRKMQTYQPPLDNIYEALLSDPPSEPSEEEVLLRKIHIQWVDLHAATRDNLLKFENPGFQLPRRAVGEQNVKTLVSFMCCCMALFSTERRF